MSEPDPAVLRHQVLADPTGRRRRRLAVAGRVATIALGLWLVVLILGGLGLQPLAGLPIVGHLGVREAAPPALPGRVQAAVARHTTVAPTAVAVLPSVRTVRVPPRRPAVTAPAHAKTRPRARTTPTTPHARIKTTPGRALTSPVPAPSLTTTSPSSTVPGQIHTETSPSSTAPGQTKTEPGQPTTTPGTTPGSNAEAHAKGTVTTP
jgi:hypothetical protein